MEDHVTEPIQQHTAEDDTEPTTQACALSPALAASSTSTNSGNKHNSIKNMEPDTGEKNSNLSSAPAKSKDETINSGNVDQAGDNTKEGEEKKKQIETIGSTSKDNETTFSEDAGILGDNGQECGLLHESMVITENVGSQHPVLLTESEETKLDKQKNNGETTGNNSGETSGPTIPDIDINIEEMAPPAVDGASPWYEETKEENHVVEIKTPETTTHNNQVDRRDPEDTNTEALGDSNVSSAPSESEDETISSGNVDQAGDNTQEGEEKRKEIETIGSTSKDNETTFPEDTGILGGTKSSRIAMTIVVTVALAILVQYLWQPESAPQINDVRQIDIFLRELEKLKTQFPNQRSELWNRSRIHLKRHLQTAQPTEPVSLILTAGFTAEKTLHCLAHGLASAFSSALNASFLPIDGVSKANEDSDKVKLDIDQLLQKAFEGDKPVAVIHRLEELPPGSTLIFYRYCDHENAAFKKTFLIFTVLLQEEEAIPAKIRLSDVEEMVDDHLQRKFLSDGHPVSFDRMDLDKYGGLWSRISHLILPVASEQRIEHDGCEET